MDSFEELLQAIEAYSDANAEYKKAKEGCREAYFMSREIEARDKAKLRLRYMLELHIKKVASIGAGLG